MIVQRLKGVLVLLASVAWLWPVRVVQAGTCGQFPDPIACLDAAQYDIWKTIASGLWEVNRIILIGTYQVHQFRWWIIDTVFVSAYDAMYAIVGPLMEPLAVLALTIAALALVAFPIFMKQRMLVGVRQIIILIALGSVVVPQAGQWVADIEHMRSYMVGTIFGEVQSEVPGWLFGVQARQVDMSNVEPLYPASCGGFEIARASDALTLADAAGALLWADAVDLHCPSESGVSVVELPAEWTNRDTANYAYNGNLGDEGQPGERQMYIQNIKQGMWRAGMAIIPSLVALFEELIQFLFSLCLIALALALPIMWVYAYFQDSYAGLLRLVSGGIQVIKVSLVSSFLLSIISTALVAATQLGDGRSFIAFSVFGFVLLCIVGIVAVKTLFQCVMTMNDSVSVATGYSVAEPAKMAADGIGKVASASVHAAGAAVSAGGTVAGAVATGAAGYMVSNSPQYGMGLAAGNSQFARPMALAEAMGRLPESASRGLHTGVHLDRYGLTPQTAQRIHADATALKKES